MDKALFQVMPPGGATGSDRVRMRNRYILYYYYSSSTTYSTSTMATGSDRRSRDPNGVPLGVHMRNRTCAISALVRPFHRKLATGCDDSHVTRMPSLEGCTHGQPKVAQYPPWWGISPEVTSSNVTHRASPGTGSHVIGSALGVLSRTSAAIIVHELTLSLVICPFPTILFS